MAWAHPDLLDNGIAYLRANASRMLLIPTYTPGESYASVVGKKLAEASLTPSDWTMSDGAAGARVCTSAAGKIVTATGNAPGPVAPATTIALFWAFTDSTGKVLWVTSGTSEQAIVADKPYIFPPLSYTSHQPEL